MYWSISCMPVTSGAPSHTTNSVLFLKILRILSTVDYFVISPTLKLIVIFTYLYCFWYWIHLKLKNNVHFEGLRKSDEFIYFIYHILNLDVFKEPF